MGSSGNIIADATAPLIKPATDLYGEVSGANAAARAAERAATAEQQQRSANLSAALADRNRFMELAQATSPAEIRAQEQALNQQTRNVEKQASLYDALDPAIMEASKQALNLLRGEESKALAPIKNQRQRQREKLLNTLREQLGPGAETSTAGMQALSQFDAETDTLLGNAQQSSLGTLFGMGQSGAAGRGGLGASTSTLQGILGQQIGQRTSAFAAGTDAVNAARGGVAQTAGAQYTGDLLRAQNQMQLTNMGVQAGLAYMTGGASAAGGLGANKTGAGATAGGSYKNYGNMA